MVLAMDIQSAVERFDTEPTKSADAECSFTNSELTVDSEEQNPLVFVGTDYPYRIVRITASFSELFGFKEDELTRSSLRLIFGPESDTNQLKIMILDSVRNLKEVGSFIFYKKNGDQVRCRLKVLPAAVSECEVTGLSFIVSDITVGRDLPFSATKPERRKDSEETNAIDERISRSSHLTQQCKHATLGRSSSTPDLASSVVDSSVLLHMTAVRRAAAAAAKHRK